MSFGREHLEYIQRTHGLAALESSASTTAVPLASRRLWQVLSVGVTTKEINREQKAGERIEMPSLDMLMGLHAFRIPVALELRGQPDRISISIGTFVADGQVNSSDQSARIASDRQQIVKAALQSSFRSIELRALDPTMEAPKAAGLVVGMPSLKPPDPNDGALPLDRLVRALSGATWGCLILAEPITESIASSLRQKAADDLKAAQFYVQNLKYPDPLAAHYAQLIEATVSDYTFGMALGSWRTSVYLWGDDAGYSRLGAVWQGIFSGSESLHMPIRIVRDKRLPTMIQEWRISNSEGAPSPSAFRHLYEHQTILTSDRLGAYVHLPRLETNGFAVRLSPSFDVTPARSDTDEDSLSLGHVMSDRRVTSAPYSIRLASLRTHAFVAGVTSSGKTTTVFSLLTHIGRAGVPFLVIEPAKAEYRKLLGAGDMRKPVRVFTLGNERVSPLRINPFEPVGGASVSVHLDLLRSAFNASFGMWNPLPQVLEQCLHAVYVDRGWNLSSNTNSRDPTGSSPLRYPTLSDLLLKVDEITPRLGYDEKIASDIRAALRIRLSSLCTGGKGLLLDVRVSTPPEALFDGQTVLELEELGDDDDKAFLMALILIRGWEYLRALGEASSLRHVLVIEEAHRLLSNVPNRGGEESNPRAKAVETFTNLLAEIRAFGQGVIIVDQVPVRLAPEVIKNTNLKIAHRVVAADDRAALAGAMAMNEQQSLAISTLETGNAAVYSMGDDSPLLVRIDSVGERARPTDNAVRDAMQDYNSSLGPRHWGCAAALASRDACELARTLAESSGFQRDIGRLVLSSLSGDPDVPHLLWRALAARFEAARSSTLDFDVLAHCSISRGAELFADRWGAVMSWRYADVEELALRVQAFALDLGRDSSLSLTELRACVERLTQRSFDPYPHCAVICHAKPRTCLYRHATASLVGLPVWRTRWNNATREDQPRESREATWQTALDATLRILAGSESSDQVRRAALCFSQQMLAADDDLLADTREIAFHNIVDASQRSAEDVTT